MKIDINIERKYKINGKEYNSIEEMPDDIREVFKKTKDLQKCRVHGISPTLIRPKIFFNDLEYDSIEAMPQDVRQLYESVLKVTEAGAVSSEIDIAGISSGIVLEPKTTGTARPVDNRKSINVESSFSPLALIISIMAAALILLLYYIFKGK